MKSNREMKQSVKILLFLFIFIASEQIMAQYGRTPTRYGRQGRTAIPQAQTPPKEPEKLTAEEYVEKEMPGLIEVLELDPFEEAVVRTVLVNSVQKRMELQILKLDQQKMREEMEKIKAEQDEALKNGLPEEKYQTYLELVDNPSKTKRKRKKKKKKG